MVIEPDKKNTYTIMHIIKSNQTIFDLSLLIEGRLDTLVQDVMIKYQLIDINEIYVGTKLDIKYNILNDNVRYFYVNKKDIESMDYQLFETFKTDLGEFDANFDDSYAI